MEFLIFFLQKRIELLQNIIKCPTVIHMNQLAHLMIYDMSDKIYII